MTTCPINIDLYTGAKMPALGYGTWQANDDELEAALNIALETGYRHIDTAAAYANEHVIGKVLKKWLDAGKLKREDLFIVTKLPPAGHRPSSVEPYITKSLAHLQLDYVDLYLVHTPFGFADTGDLHPRGPDGKILLDNTTDQVATWKVMEEQVDKGRAKAIGISNFNEKQIQRILDVARIKPANLQVELHVYHQQKPLVEFCHKNNITVVAYAPLGSSGTQKLAEKMGATMNLPDLLNNEVLINIGKKHNKAASQVAIRFILQRGIATIPKSVNPARIANNFQVFDFELDEEDMKALDKLDQGEKGRAFDFGIFGIGDHPENPFKSSS